MRASVAILAIVACYRSEVGPAPIAAPLEQPRHVRTAADPLGFLPADSELVVHVDVAQLRAHPVWARFEPALLAKARPALDQIRAACNVDVVPLIRTVALGLGHLGTPQADGVIVVRGTDRTQKLACLERADPGRFAVVDPRTLVTRVGPATGDWRAILDGGAPLRGSLAFTEMFGRLDGPSWFFLDGKSQVLARAATFGIKPTAVFGSFVLSRGLTARVFVRMQNPSEAAALAQGIQTQLAAVQSFVDRLEVTAEDADVVIDLALTDEELALVATFAGP